MFALETFSQLNNVSPYGTCDIKIEWITFFPVVDCTCGLDRGDIYKLQNVIISCRMFYMGLYVESFTFRRDIKNLDNALKIEKL